MPKRPAHTSAAPIAQQFRDRLAAEQRSQGLSDSALAERTAQQPAPLAAAALWKIKNADPPRKVDLDEAQSIAAALGFATIADMLEPGGHRHGREAASRVLIATGSITAAVRALVEAVEELEERVPEDRRPEVAALIDRRRQAAPARTPGAPLVVDLTAPEVEPDLSTEESEAAVIGIAARMVAHIADRECEVLQDAAARVAAVAGEQPKRKRGRGRR